MNELETIKQRAAKRPHSPACMYGRHQLGGDCVRCDLDHAIEIAHDCDAAAQHAGFQWAQVTRERDQTQADIQAHEQHLLAWEKWFHDIVNKFIKAGEERKQARDDVLALYDFIRTEFEYAEHDTQQDPETLIVNVHDEGECSLCAAMRVTHRMADYERYR